MNRRRSSSPIARQTSPEVPVGAPLRPEPYKVARSRLANGLRVVTIETPHLHTASIALYAGVGARYETRRTNGLSHFVEHMLFRGSDAFANSYALNHAIESVGGTLYAETGRDYSLYQIPLHPSELPRGLEILGDLFTTPRFSDIELERRIILEEILEDLDEDGRNVNVDDVSRAALWGDHPLGYPITGPLSNVKRFKTDDVRAHFGEFYGAANMVLCLAGPIDGAKMMPLVERAFARLRRGRRARPLLAATKRRRAPRLRAIENDAAQTHVQLVWEGLPDSDPDYVALSALMRVLDDGMSTRLHYQICDQKGLAYHVAGGIEPLHDIALVEIDAACAPRKLPALVAEALTLVGKFRQELVSDDDLTKAKRRHRGDIEAGYDDIDGLSGWYGGTELFYKPRTHAERVKLFNAVTAEKIQRVARRVFRPERLTVAAVGPLTAATMRKVRAALRAFA
ncbi:MAG TPA: pitrilysin family protein [Polyangia bacterium]|jgi:predicted Zn-dependent peptidase